MLCAIILLFHIGLFSVLIFPNLRPRCWQFCVWNPWLSRRESIKQSKDAAGVKIYIDICEKALSSTLALLGQQTHQAFPISCWFITGIAVALLLNEKLWGYNELLSPWSFMFLWRQGSCGDWLGGAVNHESRPVKLISWTVSFHTSSLLNWEVANSLAEVKRQNCLPESNFTRFVSHLSNSADGGERLPRGDGLEVANDLQRERGEGVQRGEGERNVWPPTLPQTEWQMRGGDTFHTGQT